jgi:hypothetical protein
MVRLSTALFKQHSMRINGKTVASCFASMATVFKHPTKSVEGAQHPDRDTRFEYINANGPMSLTADTVLAVLNYFDQTK